MLFSFFSPAPFVSFKQFIFFQILICAMLISSAVLFWSKKTNKTKQQKKNNQQKQPSPLPVISLCLANLTKRRLSCWHALLPHWLPSTEALIRKTIHWFKYNFMLPWSYELSHLSSLGVRALFMLTAFLCSAWGAERICLPHLSPISLHCSSPHTHACCFFLGFFLWWDKWSHKRKSQKNRWSA